MFSLDSQILLTLAYCDQFDWSLNVEEIGLRSVKKNKDQRIKSKNLKKCLEKLISLNLLIKNDDLHCLRDSENNFKIRKEREKFSQKKWLEAKEFVNSIKKIPGIKGVFVTGSLAMSATKKNDDIDFFIVTNKNTLWLLRPLVVFLTLLKGKARLRKFHAQNSWCLNMWLEEDVLQIPPKMRSIYTAYEVCQAVCVWDRGGTEKKFLKDNKWVGNYLPEFYKQRTKEVVIPAPYRSTGQAPAGIHTTSQQLVWVGQLVNYLLWIPAYAGMTIANVLAFMLQRVYMSTHMNGSEKVDLKRAFFHPRDTRSLVFERWKASLLRISNF